MAPENNSSFSVSVVLPASGCEMMAKVQQRRVSEGTSKRPRNSGGGQARRGRMDKPIRRNYNLCIPRSVAVHIASDARACTARILTNDAHPQFCVRHPRFPHGSGCPKFIFWVNHERCSQTLLPDYAIADLSLADWDRKGNRHCRNRMPGLMAIREEFAKAQPLRARASPARCA